MKRPLTPQEKKALSLENDRRNVVAESQWGGRDAIAKRKQWVNQSHRKAVHQELSALSGGVPGKWCRANGVRDNAGQMVLGKWCQGQCVGGIGLGQLAGGAGEVAGLARVDPRDPYTGIAAGFQ